MAGCVTGAPSHVQEWWGEIDYLDALDRMTRAHADRVAGKIADSFFYLEHPAVITYGRATPPQELLSTPHNIPTHAVPRGGLATYHAPGQLVGYIVMDLSQRADKSPDIHAYLRAVEQGLIDFIAAEFDLATVRRDGFTGVWTPPDNEAANGRKLASIGVSARKWVTSHGFALNINPDMTGFQAIVPCGITDASMTSLELELHRANRVFPPRPMSDRAAVAHTYIIKALQNEGWLT